MQDLAALVGERVRAARQQKDISLGALAKLAGIGKGSLSEIENGTRNPTLGTLYSIADALGLPLANLLDGRVGSRIGSPGMEARLLDVSSEGGWTVEVYRLSFTPGGERRARGHSAGVVEHLLVTTGRLRTGPVDAERELGAGESAEWVSDQPHAYTAIGGDPVEAVLVIRSPGQLGVTSGGSLSIQTPDTEPPDALMDED